MSGFIEYTSQSVLSPEYPHPIQIGDREYISPSSAILAGENEMEVMLTYVSIYRDLYKPYQNYIFQGKYSDILNRAISLILLPRREPISTNVYQYIYPDKPLPPTEYSIRIRRNVYITDKVRDNLYRQVRPLDTTEVYDVALIGEFPVYIGKQGAFILIPSIDDVDRVESMLNNIQ